MRYWKIVAGHWESRERAPDDIKSIMLGDWLRHNYIAIGWGEDNPQHRVFRDEMQIGDKVAVVTDGFVWALGVITGEFGEATLPEGSHLYEYQRGVIWYKITKLSYRDFEKSLRNMLGANRTINELSSDQWESIAIRTS